MGIKSKLQLAITVALVAISLALVIGELLGVPLLIGYVETGSMEPTLEVGDGFIALPTAVAGDIERGDVVVFEAQSLDGGGITTHRVAEETPEGYITTGDGNAFDDQDAGEPPVQDSQIHAVVLQLDGDVVVIPSIGNVALFIQAGVGSVLAIIGLADITSYGIGTATTVFGIVLIITSVIYGALTTESRPTVRSVNRDETIGSWLILLAVIVVLLLPLMTSMMVPSETTTIQIASTERPDEGDPTRIGVGESEQLSYTVENNQFVPKVVIMESQSSGVEFAPSVVTVSHGEVQESTLTLTAPDEPGRYTRARSEHHYLHVLPTPMIVGLHNIHPLVAMSTISFVLLLPVGIAFLLLVGLRPISLRPVHD